MQRLFRKFGERQFSPITFLPIVFDQEDILQLIFPITAVPIKVYLGYEIFDRAPASYGFLKL